MADAGQAGGRLVLVVGPSGAGKDSLIEAARRALAGHPRFVFPRRLVTRPCDPGSEDHDSLTEEAFASEREAGAFFLHWGAHGLHYALPGSIVMRHTRCQNPGCRCHDSVVIRIRTALPAWVGGSPSRTYSPGCGARWCSTTVRWSVWSRRSTCWGRKTSRCSSPR